MTNEDKDRKYQLVDVEDGWLDRQLRNIEEEVANWPEWMLGYRNRARTKR